MRKCILLLIVCTLFSPIVLAEETEPVTPTLPAPFVLEIFPQDRLFTVYSGPDKTYLIGANGKAKVSTNDVIRCYGKVNDTWLMVEYEIGENRSRIGYINAKAQEPLIASFPALMFDDQPVQLDGRVDLTDDPWVSRQKLGAVSGEATLLAYLQTNWAYIETTLGGETVRGFVRPDALVLPAGE